MGLTWASVCDHGVTGEFGCVGVGAAAGQSLGVGGCTGALDNWHRCLVVLVLCFDGLLATLCQLQARV